MPNDYSHESYFSQIYTVYDYETGESANFYGLDTSERARKLRKKLNK